MDDDRKLLEEIRDLLQRQVDLLAQEAERGRKAYEEHAAQVRTQSALAEAARTEQVAQGRFYKWVVACGTVVIFGLLAFLYFYVVRV